MGVEDAYNNKDSKALCQDQLADILRKHEASTNKHEELELRRPLFSRVVGRVIEQEEMSRSEEKRKADLIKQSVC